MPLTFLGILSGPRHPVIRRGGKISVISAITSSSAIEVNSVHPGILGLQIHFILIFTVTILIPQYVSAELHLQHRCA